MAHGFASWFLILHLLALHAKGGEAIRSNVIRLNTMDDDAHNIHHHDHMHQNHDHHPSSSSSSSIDPQLKVFFLLQDLVVGQVMPIHFPHRHISPSQLLPKHEADKIPFSYSEFPNLLRLFSFAQNSLQAKAMESTLKECEVKPIKGETKICATSLESAHDFAHETFGFETEVKTLTTTHQKNSTVGLLQNYKVIEILQNIPSPKMVACHTLPYPYAVFYCHSQKSENKVVMVSLEGEDSDLVEALGVCHMDTSQWNREHVSFRVLGVEPGTTPVCHFFPSDHFVLLPFSAAM